MRIFEITRDDEIAAILSGKKLDIDNECPQMIELLRAMISNNSPLRNNTWLYTIETLEENLQWIIDTQFTNDESTTELKNKAIDYLNQISTLKKQLIF